MRISREEDLLICQHCGSRQEPVTIAANLELLGDTTQPCPLCKTGLSQGRLHGHPLLCCRQCGGMLIEMSRFAAIIDAVRLVDAGQTGAVAPPRQKPGERTLTCPSCGRAFTSHRYLGPGNVVIDTCSPGLLNWLDRGELRRIALAPDRQRDYRPIE